MKDSASLSRREIQQRKQALIADLRAAYRDGNVNSGDMAVSRRELSQRYGLSTRTISIELEQLIQEGVLYSVPRVGTFIGRAKQDSLESYLLVLPFHPLRGDFCWQTLKGFEERIAQLGGATLALTEREALEYQKQGDLPVLAGIFELSLDDKDVWEINTTLIDNVPYVRFDDDDTSQIPCDLVHFDDVEGGRQAAQHLLRMGHSRIAYLGLNVPDSDSVNFHWSAKREEGWREIITAAGLEARAFHPSAIPDPIVDGTQIRMGLEAANLLIKQADITAVTAANVTMAQTLLMALRTANIPTSRWPAIICFDDATDVDGMVVSSLRLPWDIAGREAANILWERKHGRLTGPPQKRLVPMSLIPRLTCRQDWGRSSALAQRQASFATL